VLVEDYFVNTELQNQIAVLALDKQEACKQAREEVCRQEEEVLQAVEACRQEE
jgi:hypothetical protein